MTAERAIREIDIYSARSASYCSLVSLLGVDHRPPKKATIAKKKLKRERLRFFQ